MSGRGRKPAAAATTPLGGTTTTTTTTITATTTAPPGATPPQESATDSTRLDTQAFTKTWKKIRSSTPQYDPQLLARAIRPQEVYGELNPNMVAHIIKSVGITAKDVFFELGSGVGNVVLHVATQVGCEAIGIEPRAELHDIAEALKQQALNLLGENYPIGKVSFRTGGLMSDQVAADINRATVVLTNNLAWSPEQETQVLEKFQLVLQPGTRVVSLRSFAPRFRPTSLIFRHHPCQMFEFPWDEILGPRDGVSWSNKPIPYQVYVVAKKDADNLSTKGEETASEPQEEPSSPAKTPTRRTPRRVVAKRSVPPKRRVAMEDLSQMTQEEDTQSQRKEEEEEEEEAVKPKARGRGRRKTTTTVEDLSLSGSLQSSSLTAPPSVESSAADVELMELLVGMPPLKRKKKEKAKEAAGEEEVSAAAQEWKQKYEEAAKKLEGMDGVQLKMDVLEAKLQETEGELAERSMQLQAAQARCRDLEALLCELQRRQHQQPIYPVITPIPTPTVDTTAIPDTVPPTAAVEVEESQQPQSQQETVVQGEQPAQVSEESPMQVEDTGSEESRKRKRQEDWCSVQ